MIYSERKRIKQLQEKEASGENVWTEHVTPKARQKILWVIERFGRKTDSESGLDEPYIFSVAHAYITHSRGVPSLAGASTSTTDLTVFMKNCSDEDFPDVLESLRGGVKLALDGYAVQDEMVLEFEADINTVLESYRISYSLEQGQIVDFSSRELHTQVVAPALILLANAGWESVESAYQDSLREIAGGNTQDAITDVGTALQEGLRKIGCKGDDFGKLLASAKTTVFNGYDSRYITAIEQLIGWVSAARSNRGDTHKVAKPSKDDAWFVIHTVGILLLRLSKMEPTDKTTT